MKKNHKKAFDKEQELEEKANNQIIGLWEKMTNNSKFSNYLIVGIVVVIMIIIFVILAVTKVI